MAAGLFSRRLARKTGTRHTSLITAATEALESRRLFTASVPSPLQEAEIGTPTGGSSSYDPNTQTITVTGAGNDVFGSNDAFYYVYQPLTGDGTITARITSDTPSNSGAELAGLDIRSSLSDDAANMYVAARDDQTLFVNDRTADATSGSNLVGSQQATFPTYLQLSRVGNVITASTSTDGVTFTELAHDTVTLPSTALVGIAVASHSGNAPAATATFDHFTVAAADPHNAFIYGNVSTPKGVGLVGQHLWLDSNSNGVYDPGEATATSDASGNYFFSGLAAGTYHVRLFASGGEKITTPAGGAQDASPTVSQVVSGVNFVASQPAGYIFGKVSTPLSKGLTGQHLFLDTNNDGVYQPGELTATSDASGNYFFSGLTVGTYHVKLFASGGEKYGTPSTGAQDVVLTEGQVASGINFTASQPTAYIYGKVSNATSNAGLAGQHLFIDANDNGIYNPGELAATSDASGNYFFSGLTVGTYHVRLFAAAGVTTTPTTGKIDVTVTEGQVSSGNNFKTTATS